MSEDSSSRVAGAASSSLSLELIANVASHSWRMSRLARRAIEKLPPQDGSRLANQLRFADRQISDELATVGVQVVDLEGERFDAGMAVTSLNASDFAASDDLVVAQMIEPIVLGPSGLLKYGVVMLGKVGG